jgi:glycosyltransferase involved in cell wall biosynthesis
MALTQKVDVVHFHGVGNALFFPLHKILSRSKTLLVVDGPDWNRPKWGWLARTALRTAFPMAARLGDEIISDNRPVQDMFRDQYGLDTEYVVYGANQEPVGDTGECQTHGLVPGKYLVQVGAMVPDKGAHLSVDAYEKIDTEFPLIIVGDTLYAHEYKNRVMSTKDPRIHFLGYIFGEKCRDLVKNAYAYIHPLIVDGTSPALLQAMALGKCVISTDLPETRGVVEDVAILFKSQNVEDLREKIIFALQNPDKVAAYGKLAAQRIEECYNWDVVARQYEALSYKALGLPYDKSLFDTNNR